MKTYDRTVYLAVFLLILGGILLATGLGLYTRGDPADSGIALTSLGCIVFLPGFWASYHAYTAWKRSAYSDELMAMQ